MAAKENLIVTTDITVNPREIDFVTRFQRNWQHLRDIMGIMRPIRMQPGTTLKSKYAEGTLQSGTVAEGEEIPYSKFTVKEKTYADITVEKFAKAVSLEAIKKYVINPVEAREASLDERSTLKMEFAIPTEVETLTGFTALDDDALEAFRNEKGLAMDHADIVFCQNYFKSEHRDPTITEIRLIDTYWSDHCRHTTFGTVLDDVTIDDAVVQQAFDRYMEMRHELGRDAKPVCLMDMGTIGAKYLKKTGVMTDVDESEEINACTVKVKVDVDGEDQDWLFLFKNETHNHPTEIEPFGGAATCMGGAIRDPLSGRSYVYQAMRVTGAGDPTVPVSETLEGKLPQRKLVTTAAAGYSSYGNQIGLATARSTSSITPVTWPSAWRSAPSWAPPRQTTFVASAPPPPTRSSCWAAAPAVTASVAPPAPPRPRTPSPSRPRVPKSRRATPRSSANCSVCSAAAMPAV